MNNLIKLNGILFLLVLNISLSIAQNKTEIRSLAGVPALFINEQLYPPFAYMSYLGETKYYKEVAQAGVHLYCFPAYLGDRGINATSGIGPFRSPVWTGENQYDLSSIETDFKKIIEADPHAKIIIRIHLDPPVWWEKQNPDASCHLADGTTFRQCFSSEKWRSETGKVLEHCITWLLESSYSKYLIGIHVAAGSTEEWFYHSQQYDDRNPARVNAFRKWLIYKYNGNEIELQKSWCDSHVTFSSAQTGNVLEDRNRRWRDSDLEQKIIDTYQFHSETMVENIEYFCKTVKETSNRTLLTGIFYGYHYYVTDPRRGHGALAGLLECEDLDYLSSPNVYNRVIGEDWPPMAAIQSVHLHRKLWLAENDTRTSITTLLKDQSQGIAPPGQYESGVWLGPPDMETSVSFLWKNAGRMLTRGYGGWWFDMWGGWFSDPKLLNVIGKTNKLYTAFPQEKGNQMQAQVCVIVDEQLCFWDASYGQLTEQILSNRYPLAKTGTSYDLFLRTDLELVAAQQYKVIWLMGFPKLSETEKVNIQNWQNNGITVMWTDNGGTHILKNHKDNYLKNEISLSDSQLRKIFESAGVHIYSDSGDIFYIGRNWLCIHTVSGGKKTINLPFPAQVVNPFEEKIVSDSTKTIKLTMAPKSTQILRINPTKDQ
jgi:beta-galactosidase